MPYPSGATDRITFEKKRTTVRTKKMILAARFLFKVRGGGSPPAITQGGWRPVTDYSKDTHGEDAIDFATKLFSETRSKLWERCLWEVGFASWRRIYIKGLWSAHTHALPKEGQLSDGADGQIKQWYQGDDALKSDRNYPGILTSGLVARTWEKFNSAAHGGHIDLVAAIRAFKNASAVGSNDIHQIQTRLNLYMGSSLLVDGIPGPATAGVLETFQSRALGPWSQLPSSKALQLLGFEVIL